MPKNDQDKEISTAESVTAEKCMEAFASAVSSDSTAVTRKRLTYLFNKTLIMQDAYFLLLGLWFSHTRGSFRSFRLAAESFCIRYSLSPPTPRTSSIVGDCWLCCLIRMDVSCALWITRIWREIYHSFLKKQNYNCYLIKSECYSSFMFNLN